MSDDTPLGIAHVKIIRTYVQPSSGNMFAVVHITYQDGEVRRVDVRIRDGLHGPKETRDAVIKRLALEAVSGGKDITIVGESGT